jgi:hypothetical protein
MAPTKKDPTVTGATTGAAYPDGTHPARPASEVTHSATNINYRDNPEKPDRTSVAQIEVASEANPGI